MHIYIILNSYWRSDPLLDRISYIVHNILNFLRWLRTCSILWLPKKTVLACIIHLCSIMLKQTLDPRRTAILGCSRLQPMEHMCFLGPCCLMSIPTYSHNWLSTLVPSPAWLSTVRKYMTFTPAPKSLLLTWLAGTWCMFEPIQQPFPKAMWGVILFTASHHFVDGNCKPINSTKYVLNKILVATKKCQFFIGQMSCIVYKCPPMCRLFCVLDKYIVIWYHDLHTSGTYAGTSRFPGQDVSEISVKKKNCMPNNIQKQMWYAF